MFKVGDRVHHKNDAHATYEVTAVFPIGTMAVDWVGKDGTRIRQVGAYNPSDFRNAAESLPALSVDRVARALFETDPRLDEIYARRGEGRSRSEFVARAWNVETQLRSECEARAARMMAVIK